MDDSIKQKLLKTRFFENDFILIDTCSFLQKDIEQFLECFFDIYLEKRNKNQHVVLHESILSELEKLRENGKMSNAVTRAIYLIKDTYGDVFETAGNSVVFGDASIFRAVIGLRLVGTVLIVTEDKRLTHDCLLLNQLRSQKGKKVSVISVGGIMDGEGL